MALWWLQRQIRPIGLGGLRNAAHGDGSRLPTPRIGRDVRPCSPSRLEGREVVGGGHSLSLSAFKARSCARGSLFASGAPTSDRPVPRVRR